MFDLSQWLFFYPWLLLHKELKCVGYNIQGPWNCWWCNFFLNQQIYCTVLDRSLWWCRSCFATWILLVHYMILLLTWAFFSSHCHPGPSHAPLVWISLFCWYQLSRPKCLYPSTRKVLAPVSLLDSVWWNLKVSIVPESILSSKGQFASNKLSINCDTWATHKSGEIQGRRILAYGKGINEEWRAGN